MDEIENQRVMQFLIDNGADVNPRNKYGLTPLHCAVLHRNRCVIDMLIQAGADINAKSSLKRTALHFAISNYQHKQWKRTLPSDGTCSDIWMVKKLLDQENIRVNVGDVRGDTPLMWAVMEKQVDIMIELLNKGANPNTRNKDSLTPLHVALSAKDPCIYTVVLLLMYRASLICEDKEGRTPIDILIQNARNSQSYRFVYRCFENIALICNIKKPLKRKLEMFPQLWDYLKNCCDEIELMKLDVIVDRFTVFDLMLKHVNDSDFENPLLQFYIPVVNRLLAGFYPKYFHHIFEDISKWILCTILENTIYERNCAEECKEFCDADECKEYSDTEESKEFSDTEECIEFTNVEECKEFTNVEECKEFTNAEKCTKINGVDFFSKVDIFMLSKYLSRLDIFCLIVAFSNGKVHESMQHIREHEL